jgi:hypothetical protein
MHVSKKDNTRLYTLIDIFCNSIARTYMNASCTIKKTLLVVGLAVTGTSMANDVPVSQEVTASEAAVVVSQDRTHEVVATDSTAAEKTSTKKRAVEVVQNTSEQAAQAAESAERVVNQVEATPAESTASVAKE